MRNPILIASDDRSLCRSGVRRRTHAKDVRAMSDDELYALADTLSSEDETRLYQQARKEFPDGALGLQSVRNELAKRENELEVCERAIEDDMSRRIYVPSMSVNRAGISISFG